MPALDSRQTPDADHFKHVRLIADWSGLKLKARFPRRDLERSSRARCLDTTLRPVVLIAQTKREGGSFRAGKSRRGQKTRRA